MAAGVVAFAVVELRYPSGDGRWSLPTVECENLSPNFTIETVGEVPELIASLLADGNKSNMQLLYVGTHGNGGVYRLKPHSPYSMATLLPATGVAPAFGVSQVSVLAFAD